MTLTDIAKRIESSKFTGHSYMPVYDELIGPLKDEPIHLLEIGIDRGNSLLMWLEYFTQATIHGIEANPFTHFADPRLKTYVCDAGSPAIGQIFPPESLDVIIDDASHIPREQHSAFHFLWPALKPGGIYFIEDIKDPNEILAWSHQDKFKVYANFRTGYGSWRDDDIFVVIRK